MGNNITVPHKSNHTGPLVEAMFTHNYFQGLVAIIIPPKEPSGTAGIKRRTHDHGNVDIINMHKLWRELGISRLS